MLSGGAILTVLSVAIAGLLALAVVFAVVALVLRWGNVRRARRWSALEKRWETELLDVLAGAAPDAALLSLVEPRDATFFVGILVRYARQLRGAERETMIRLARPYLDVIAAQLGERSAERRARAVQTLSILAGETHHGTMRRALDDPSPLVAMVAARALARRADPDIPAAILERIERFEAWSPRYLASMLGWLGPDAAAPLCATLADPGRRAWVRAVAADALVQIHHLAAADVAAAVLEGTGDRELLAASLRLLAALGRPDHLARIRPFLDARDAVVRAAATRALASLGDAGERDRLREALDDPSPWVALDAAEGLAASGGLDVLRALAASDAPRAVLARQVLREAAA